MLFDGYHHSLYNLCSQPLSVGPNSGVIQATTLTVKIGSSSSA